MKRSFALIFALLLVLSGCAAAGARSGDISGLPAQAEPSPAAQASFPAETPTGRSDGLPEETYVFWHGTLYVRDYLRFTGEEERYVRFADYSALHPLTPVGEVRSVDDTALPAEELCAYMAQVGDRLYTDENGVLYLRRADDVLYAMKPAE